MVGGRVLDVVICTYDNASMLDVVLARLAAQTGAEASEWAVLVVDNNSTDATAAVVERHRLSGAVPGLRRVREARQGLSHARLRGVLETDAPWVAFVDDDCLLDAGWIAGVLATLAARPDAAGVGGRVVLAHEAPPAPYLRDYGWAFAAQDHGDEPTVVASLVGAGMVVRRSALERCGWTRGPLLQDRVGTRLVSGGDVELALRLAATGDRLWYTPVCRLEHVIPARRTQPRYMLRLVRGLGTSQAFADALVAGDGPGRWLVQAVGSCTRQSWSAVTRAARGRPRRVELAAAALDGAFAWGRWRGTAAVASMLVRRRCPFFGVAATGAGPAGQPVSTPA